VRWADELILEGTDLFSHAAYTAKKFPIGIGQGVRAELIDASGTAILYLTSNTTGITESTTSDSHFARLDYIALEDTFVNGVGGCHSWHSNLSTVVDRQPSREHPFIMQILRESGSRFRFSVYDSDMTPILSGTNSFSSHVSSPYTDELYISLESVTRQGAIVVFDNITVVPEPATLLLLGLGGLALRGKRQ
jgi:hypothetical protein